MIVMLGSAPAVVAQGRDRAERGHRLEIDELRNDVRQDRVKQSQSSGSLLQPQQGEPGLNANQKAKRSKKKK
jgi:hypothetical protein